MSTSVGCPQPRSAMWGFLADFVGCERFAALEDAASVKAAGRESWLRKHNSVTVVASGLGTKFDISPRGEERDSPLWNLYLPFILLLKEMVRMSRQNRILCGFVAAAGAGKTTTCQILKTLYNDYFGGSCEGLASSQPPSAQPCAMPAGTVSKATVISMDAFHRYNADLINSGLKSHKGRIDTIDAVNFASCLESVVAAGAEGRAVRVPEYDRQVTHDPVEDATLIGPDVEVVLVEGLYLCAGGLAPPSAATSAQLSAWERIRGLLDVVFYIDVPLEECRQRVVNRKVLGGVPREESEAYYSRVDYPTFQRLKEVDSQKPPPTPPAVLRPLAIESRGIVAADAELDGAGCGPDIVLSIVDTKLQSVVVRHRPGLSVCEKTSSAHTGSVHRCIVLGLNPCLQNTLVFGERAPDGASTLTAGWERGRVNRAKSAVHSVGGKGQHAALAFATSAAASLTVGEGDKRVSSKPHALLFQFAAGEEGKKMLNFLESRANDVAVGWKSGSLPLDVRTFDFSSTAKEGSTGDSCARTRTCTTLIDLSVANEKEGMTELIEPSAAVNAETVMALQQAVQDDLSKSDYPPLVIMGTSPPGAASVYLNILSWIADHGCRFPVMLDLSSGVAPLLKTNAVTILKVNRIELASIAKEAGIASSTATTVTADGDDGVIVADVQGLFSLFPGLQMVAVTDGPLKAHLLLRSEAGKCRYQHWSFGLPSDLPRPFLNPIGAGDTVAGVFAHLHLVQGMSAPEAYRSALAAASASCCSILGADWREEDALAIKSKTTMAFEGEAWF
jgi:fructose-1-phosphate kinase PfkB-like protein/uridine kinase